MRPVNRIEPQGPPEAYKSYQILAPPQTHFRPATCEEVRCAAHLRGWVTKLDEGTDMGRQLAHYVRNDSGRRYTEKRNGPITTFTFIGGQQCFRRHQLRLDRPALFVVRDGDYRRSTNRRVHASAEDWVDDFATHQDHIAGLRQKG